MIPFGCLGFLQVILISVASTSASCKSNTAPGTKNQTETVKEGKCIFTWKIFLKFLAHDLRHGNSPIWKLI
jgi:hypothetical protein